MKIMPINETPPALTVGTKVSTFLPGPLTVEDRCDRCQSAAYVAVSLTIGASLLFCAHHYNKYEVKLNELGALIQDERYRLVASEILRKKDGVSA